MKKKGQSNVTAKNKPDSAKDNGTKRAANTKEECEEKEKVVQEKAIDGESVIYLTNKPRLCSVLL